MAHKQKKKRNKQYQGQDAATSRPVVTRISAVNRSKAGQWWVDRKRILKPVIIAVVVALVAVAVIIELIQIATH